MIRTLAELKENAIIVTDGMETYFPQFSKKETLKLSGLNPDSHKLAYAYNNGVVAFVDNEGNLYVIPDIKGTQKVLSENGYSKEYFYVPFSNWDYPVAAKEVWEWLWSLKNSKK